MTEIVHLEMEHHHTNNIPCPTLNQEKDSSLQKLDGGSRGKTCGMAAFRLLLTLSREIQTLGFYNFVKGFSTNRSFLNPKSS